MTFSDKTHILFKEWSVSSDGINRIHNSCMTMFWKVKNLHLCIMKDKSNLLKVIFYTPFTDSSNAMMYKKLLTYFYRDSILFKHLLQTHGPYKITSNVKK